MSPRDAAGAPVPQPAPPDDAALEAATVRLKAAGVHTLLVQFTDVEGVAKGKLVPLHRLADVARDGAGFSGPSIVGTGLPRTGPRSEYMARGDLSTLQPLPWMPGIARIVGDGFAGGRPFEGCPRQVLRRAVARLSARGWTLRCGLEPEFFLLKRGAPDGTGWAPADDLDRLDKPSYDLKSLPRQMGFLQALRSALEAAGLVIEQIDHEDAHGQYEVNFGHDEVLRAADTLMLFKLAAHALADERGLVFSMMPKPFADQPGSGLHVHASLWRGGRCLFDPGPEAGGGEPLSDMGRWFMGGVLHHAPGLAALAAPTVNSYKRLTVGESRSGTTWAPASISHGPNNRTALVRTLPGRFEWRLPDASANPYLMLAGLVAAGLSGIDRRIDPGPPTAADLFALPWPELRSRGVKALPQSLAEAADALEADAVLADALGPALHAEIVRMQRAEHIAHARHVSAWELARYAERF